MRLWCVLVAALSEGAAFKLAVREASAQELQPARPSFRAITELAAGALFEPATDRDRNALAGALGKDFAGKFGGRCSEAALLLALDDTSDEYVGVCGVGVEQLSPAAVSDRRARGAEAELLRPRPLLSNLAVSPTYRRRGIAKRLCRAAEATASSWGYSELLIKVEADNTRARKLYRKLGYRTVGEDPNAERPVAAGGRLRFVPATTIAMRKDLRFPPVDALVAPSALILLAAGVASAPDRVEAWLRAIL